MGTYLLSNRLVILNTILVQGSVCGKNRGQAIHIVTFLPMQNELLYRPIYPLYPIKSNSII